MIKQVTVIGSGTMGNGIAHTFAQFGFNVVLLDISDQALENALRTITLNLDRQVKKEIINEQQKREILGRIKIETQMELAVARAELIIEAATENPGTKLDLFRQVSELCGEDVILASNTSSISITKIASVTKHPENVIGMHFMNPVPVMKLVEVIKGYATSDSTTKTIMELSLQLNKVPVEVNDYPGFGANRILMPMINEAIYTLFEGVAGVEEIDTVMKFGMAHPMGPLQLADFIGLDVCLSVLKVMHEGLGNPKYAPCPLLINMVTAGQLGIKSGIGFYKYTPGSKDLLVAAKFQK